MKKKIRLQDIKVKSFVTELKPQQGGYLKGGAKQSEQSCGVMRTCFIDECVRDITRTCKI